MSESPCALHVLTARQHAKEKLSDGSKNHIPHLEYCLCQVVSDTLLGLVLGELQENSWRDLWTGVLPPRHTLALQFSVPD